MIGVMCKENERDVVREFFELFKTPWRFFERGGRYEVVISTLPEEPAPHARLFILYSSSPASLDARKGISLEPGYSRYLTSNDGIKLPVFGPTASLNGRAQPLLHDPHGRRTAAIRFREPETDILRVGYDVFHEVRVLLSEGQSRDNALIPTLELHISLLRDWILDSGIPLVEIPPVPWGHAFIACLTHDVDFGGIRLHKLDRTAGGFVYRALLGSLIELARGRRSLSGLIKNWIAVFSLPLVHLGVARDFWNDFDEYAEIEKGLASTYFLIPFKNRAGAKIKDGRAAWRAARYDIGDMKKQVRALIRRGFEIGLHGIDAWHDSQKGKQEIRRIVEVTGREGIGVRVHWLCFDRGSFQAMEQAGFDYDSTVGYNDAVGYKAGTTQAFRPPGLARLMELPLHIQDTALFSPKRLALTPEEAWNACGAVLEAAGRFAGVVTVSWHQRSLAPERLWAGFYMRLVREMKSRDAWFGTAAQVVEWFRRRRSMTIEDDLCTADTIRLRIRCGEAGRGGPPLFVRVHKPGKSGPGQRRARNDHFDFPYAGEPSIEFRVD